MKIKKFDEFDTINEFNKVTGGNVARIEYQRERKEILDKMVGILNRASLEQLQSWEEILGW